jgi:hypothetical protein
LLLVSRLSLTDLVVNKCLTILLNVAIWDKHAEPGGILCLFICIAGGMVYQQAPMRSDKKDVQSVSAEDDAFKTDVSAEAHESTEEMADLLEKQSSSARKR